MFIITTNNYFDYNKIYNFGGILPILIYINLVNLYITIITEKIIVNNIKKDNKKLCEATNKIQKILHNGDNKEALFLCKKVFKPLEGIYSNVRKKNF